MPIAARTCSSSSNTADGSWRRAVEMFNPERQFRKEME
jgi:hypothetical protein